MSEYPEAGFLKEFVRRTRCNLMLVEKNTKETNTEAYEVTQLFNSLLGLLILPKEKYSAKLGEVLDKEVPVFQRFKPRIEGPDKDTINYQQAIRHLRNAVGHPNNIEFGVNDDNKEITKIIFKDQSKFKIELSIVELKALVFELCDVLIKKISAEGL